MEMTLIIKTEAQYKPLFDELAKAIGAQIEDINDETAESAFLNRLEQAYGQSRQHERGEINLPTLDEFLKTL